MFVCALVEDVMTFAVVVSRLSLLACLATPFCCGRYAGHTASDLLTLPSTLLPNPNIGLLVTGRSLSAAYAWWARLSRRPCQPTPHAQPSHPAYAPTWRPHGSTSTRDAAWIRHAAESTSHAAPRAFPTTGATTTHGP